MTTRSTTGASMCTGAARAAQPMPEETSAPPRAAEVCRKRLRSNEGMRPPVNRLLHGWEHRRFQPALNAAGTMMHDPRPHSLSSDDASSSEVVDLRRSVAEFGEDFAVVCAELRSDADLRGGFREVPRRAVNL